MKTAKFDYLRLPRMEPADVLEAIKHMDHTCRLDDEVPCAVCFVFSQTDIQRLGWARNHADVVKAVSWKGRK